MTFWKDKHFEHLGNYLLKVLVLKEGQIINFFNWKPIGHLALNIMFWSFLNCFWKIISYSQLWTSNSVIFLQFKVYLFFFIYIFSNVHITQWYADNEIPYSVGLRYDVIYFLTTSLLVCLLDILLVNRKICRGLLLAKSIILFTYVLKIYPWQHSCFAEAARWKRKGWSRSIFLSKMDVFLHFLANFNSF